jgi:eukaryotic translation initiation factor 2C
MGACVASLDTTFGKWAAETIELQSRMELKPDLGSSFKALLNKFRHIHRQQPSMVIYFRDGVGQSQIDAVHQSEIPTLRSVLGQDVPICVVLVTKRHHVRLFKVRKSVLRVSRVLLISITGYIEWPNEPRCWHIGRSAYCS